MAILGILKMGLFGVFNKKKEEKQDYEVGVIGQSKDQKLMKKPDGSYYVEAPKGLFGKKTQYPVQKETEIKEDKKENEK